MSTCVGKCKKVQRGVRKCTDVWECKKVLESVRKCKKNKKV